MILNSILSGQHVRLRPMSVDDAELTYGWRMSPRAQLLGGAPKSAEGQIEWIRSRPSGECNWVIETESVPIGTISLIDIDLENCHAQSARFLIAEERAASGIPAAVEAIYLMYEFAFGELGLHRIYGFIASRNQQMIRWQSFLGMRTEGVWRQHLRVGDEYADATLMGLLVAEYSTVTRLRLLQMLKMGRGR